MIICFNDYDVISPTFPYLSKVDGTILWDSKKYRSSIGITWENYYNRLIALEKAYQILYVAELISYEDKNNAVTKVRLHRDKFIRRLYKLGILSGKVYDVYTKGDTYTLYDLVLKSGYSHLEYRKLNGKQIAVMV